MAVPFRIALWFGTFVQFLPKYIVCMKKLNYQEWSYYRISRKTSLFLLNSNGFTRFNLTGMRSASSACSLSSANVRSNFLWERLYLSMACDKIFHCFIPMMKNKKYVGKGQNQRISSLGFMQSTDSWNEKLKQKQDSNRKTVTYLIR